MPVPTIPVRMTNPGDTLREIEQLWDYVARLRDALEGTEGGQPLVIETLFNAGLFPAPRSLILDGGFERFRDAWILSTGQRILQDSTLARSGHHSLACDTTSAGLYAVANQFIAVDAVPGDVLIVSGYGRRSSSGSSTGQVAASFWDKDDAAVGAVVNSTALTLTTSYQLMVLNTLIPATAVKVRFGVRAGTVGSGEAYFDDVSAFWLPYQDQHSEATGPIGFTGETVIGSVNIGSAREIGYYDVIVQAVATITTANADNEIALRIRRDNVTGAILVGSPRTLVPSIVSAHPVFTMGFDSDPNTTSQTYVLTAQRTAGTGTPQAYEITMLVSQRNILMF